MARVTQELAKGLSAEMKIGKYVARAESRASFVAFEEVILGHAKTSLTSPTRLLTIPHLRNSIAARLDDADRATTELIDGYILHWLERGRLFRLNTVSRAQTPYQAVSLGDASGIVEESIARLLQELSEKDYVTLPRAEQLINRDLLSKPLHLEMLFGHLLYLGAASADVAPGLPIESIRLPYANPRF